jgi:dTMP kinase
MRTKVHSREAANRNTICDRYLIDTLATDIAVDFGYEPRELIQLMRLLQDFFPKPDLTVLLRIRPSVAVQRKRDIEGVAYLNDRLRYYDSLIREVPGEVVIENGEPRSLRKSR